MATAWCSAMNIIHIKFRFRGNPMWVSSDKRLLDWRPKSGGSWGLLRPVPNFVELRNQIDWIHPFHFYHILIGSLTHCATLFHLTQKVHICAIIHFKFQFVPNVFIDYCGIKSLDLVSQHHSVRRENLDHNTFLDSLSSSKSSMLCSFYDKLW